MTNDWHFVNENTICLFRTVGVLLRDNKIFVQCDNDVYALPGGHVKIGETSEETLIREYKEETGADIICNRLIWVEETFWKWDDKDAHGIVFYYLISLDNADDIPVDYCASQKDNCAIMLKWIPIEEINNITIYPTFMKDKITAISDHVEHIIRFE